MELLYRLYGFLHCLAKVVLRRKPLSSLKLAFPRRYHTAGTEDYIALWRGFVESSRIGESGTLYAGYVAEEERWCLPSWIWTNAAAVRMYSAVGEIEKAIALADTLASCQQACGGWIVRNDYDKQGAIPVLAPNDSAYIANNAFLTLYRITGDRKYLDIAERCAAWIMETARPDALVHTGYNTRDGVWEQDWVIVDTGFTAGLFSNLVELTGKKEYRAFLSRFVKRYVELFFMSERAGFCTSIDKKNHHFGGMFARGQAWALEGLIPAYRVLGEDWIREVIDSTIGNLMKQQRKDGGWPYNLSRKMMGEDCKGTSIIVRNMMDWYKVSGNEAIVRSARKAFAWCKRHTVTSGEAKGGIFSYSVEGAIVQSSYTSCAFVYASAYALELEKLLTDA